MSLCGIPVKLQVLYYVAPQVRSTMLLAPSVYNMCLGVIINEYSSVTLWLNGNISVYVES